MATIARVGHKQRPKAFRGTGQIMRVRCCVCNAVIGETRARQSTFGSSNLRAWCKKHLPELATKK